MDAQPDYIDIVHRMFPGEKFKTTSRIEFGWTSSIILLDRKYVVKIPRTDWAALGVEKEMAVTGYLDGHIPVKVPHYIGSIRENALKAASYEFLGGLLFTNQPVDPAADSVKADHYINGENSKSIAHQIGEILSAIHSVDIASLAEPPNRYVSETWDEKIGDWLGRCRKISSMFFTGIEVSKCENFLEPLEDRFSKFKFRERFIHGDFGGWNMLFDPVKAKITGLLDWADSRYGDPAKDFTELIYDFGPEFTMEVKKHYKYETDSEIMERAKFYLSLSGFQDLEFGLNTDSQFFTNRGAESIRREISKF